MDHWQRIPRLSGLDEGIRWRYARGCGRGYRDTDVTEKHGRGYRDNAVCPADVRSILRRGGLRLHELCGRGYPDAAVCMGDVGEDAEMRWSRHSRGRGYLDHVICPVDVAKDIET